MLDEEDDTGRRHKQMTREDDTDKTRAITADKDKLYNAVNTFFGTKYTIIFGKSVS